MICACCSSDEIYLNPLGLQEYAACSECGFLFSVNNSKSHSARSILRHYRKVDPVKGVAISKKLIFKSTLRHLSSINDKKEKTLLDVGCGPGDFIKYASKKGWNSYGIEIVPELVECARKKIGKEKIFKGKLKGPDFRDNSFDAITFLDVLAIVDDIHDELSVCFRILKSGGTIGIRTRNVIFQKTIYKFYRPFRKLGRRFGVKNPYVFNRHCFSSKALSILLSRIGFKNIKITNSPLTYGDPYNHLPTSYPIKLVKTCVDICSKITFSITRGKWLIAPSFLIWAKKP